MLLRPIVVCAVVVAALAGSAGAQDTGRPGTQPRIDARNLLAGGPVWSDLATLPPARLRGYEVVVDTDDGDAVRGRVEALSADELVVAVRPRLRRARQWTFAAERVREIRIVDSTADGALKGAGAAGALVAAVAFWESRQPPGNLQGVFTLMAIGFVTPAMVVGGAMIDRRHNAPVYTRSAESSRVDLAPAFGPGRAAIVARARF